MIKNQRQYHVVKAQIEKFSRAMQNASDGDAAKAAASSIAGMIQELQKQADDYENLLDSGPLLELDSVMDLPNALIRARISSRLSQRDLAKRIGIKEQQIQRYEATEYAAASMARIREVAQALSIRSEEMPQEKAGLEEFFESLRGMGIDRGFVIKRMLPPRLAVAVEEDDYGENPQLAKMQVIECVTRILNARFIRQTVRLDTAPISQARIIRQKNSSEKKILAYAMYADHIAGLASQASWRLPKKKLPEDPHTIHKKIPGMTLGGLLEYAWGLGIVIIPLGGPGMFCGAHFEKGGRHVIVPRQKKQSSARWIFEIMHEMYHAMEGDRTIHIGSADGCEKANAFAARAMLGRDPQEMASLCMRAAKNSEAGLKETIPLIARHEGIPAPILADCVTYELSLQGKDVRVTAGAEADPRITVLDAFVKNADFGKMSEADLQTLQQALDYNGTPENI